MRRRILLKSVGGGSIDPSKATACDVCLYDKTADGLIIVPHDSWSAAAYPASGYEPIGVVVIPGSHDVYGTGECGVMSLKGMSRTNSSKGTNANESMYWGVYGTDISTLTNLNVVAKAGTNASPLSTVDGTNSYTYLPSDNFSGTVCPTDSSTKYYNTSSSNYAAPSPYLENGSRNPEYYKTASPSSTSNALADFDGVGNTEKIITQRGSKDYSSWNPTYNTQADYPAASTCDMFYTNGTKQGDWYLPACGELGYIIPRLKAINTTIAALLSAYGNSFGVQLYTNNAYWSSSERSSNDARRVGTDYGSVGNYNKDDSIYVRAFLRV